MAIRRIVLDKNTGNVDSVGESYQHTYQLIVDKTDTANTIYGYAKLGTQTVRLPIYGDSLSGIPLTDISINKSSDADFKKNGDTWCSGVDGPFSKWDYVVNYKKSEISGFSSEEAPWLQDAIGAVLEPITYDDYSCTSYKKDTTYIINAQGEQVVKTAIITNAVGKPVYRNAKLYNFMLSFTYGTKTFNPLWMRSVLNTVNGKDVQIAGIIIGKKSGVLRSIIPSMSEYNGTSYYSVAVKIEISFEKPLYESRSVGTSFSAYMTQADAIAKDESKIVDLQSWIGPDIDSVPVACWCTGYDGTSYDTTTGKKKKIGYFSTVKSGTNPKYAAMVDYKNLEEPIVLASNGLIYSGTMEQAMEESKINVVKYYDSVIADWTPLGFPRRGFI